jgi:pyrroloquinoline quinone biosynthesis protein E
MKIYFVVPDYFEGKPKPCMNGWGRIFLSVTPDGTALPCHAAADLPGLELPNVRDHSLAWIWHESPDFNWFRGESWMQQPCAGCDERASCFGGCRCQAYLLTGDAAAADPACSKSHSHDVIVRAVEHAASLPCPEQPIMRNRRNVSRVLQQEAPVSSPGRSALKPGLQTRD